MAPRSIIHSILILLAFSQLKKMLASADGYCMKYIDILPDGICKEYLRGQEVNVESKERAIKENNKLDAIYEEYIPLYAMLREAALKRMAKFYITDQCSKAGRINKIIDSMSFPSGSDVKKCTAKLKEIVCHTMFPLCMKSESGKKAIALPCRKRCMTVLKTPSCSFLRPMFQKLKAILKACPGLDRKFITRNYVGIADCTFYPASSGKAGKYCIVKKSDKLYMKSYQMSNTVVRRGEDVNKTQSRRVMENGKDSDGNMLSPRSNTDKNLLFPGMNADNWLTPGKNVDRNWLIPGGNTNRNGLTPGRNTNRNRLPVRNLLRSGRGNGNGNRTRVTWGGRYMSAAFVNGYGNNGVRAGDTNSLTPKMNQLAPDEILLSEPAKKNMRQISTHLREMSKVKKKSSNSCVPYKTILPSGVCLDYFRNSRIAQTAEDVKKINNNLGRVYAFLDILLTNSSAGELASIRNTMWSWALRQLPANCSSEQKIAKLKQKLPPKPNVDDVRKCLEGNGWFLCHIYHPNCAAGHARRNRNSVDRYDGDRKYGGAKVSPVCREACESTWSSPQCSFVRALYKMYHEVTKHCNVLYGEHVEDLFDCSKYPPLDMKHIERCHLHNITNTPVSANCYHGNGVSYNGSVNTAGGLGCDPWNSDPYLNPKEYPTLVKNYCRNPQGYGEKPWCYTDIKVKRWAYCDVGRCKTVSKMPAILQVAAGRSAAEYHRTQDTETTDDDPSVANHGRFDVIRDNSMRPSRYKKPLTAAIVVMSLMVALGVAFMVFIYRNRRREVREYRSLGQKPDINYVRVDGDEPKL